MKKFKFRLQTVHNVREMRREKEELVLTEMQSEVNRAVARLAEIEKMRTDAFENYAQKMKFGEAMNPFEMELGTNHLRSLDNLIREAQANVENKKRDCSIQSQAVAAASREVKITERLRENQQSRHRAELEKHEQNMIDELTSANFTRRLLTNE